MRNTVKLTGAVAAAAAATLALGACSAPSDPDTGKKDDASAPLVVGATSVPHAEILEYVKKDLAPKENLKLQIKTFDDYQLVNPATKDGSLDANYFQTKEFLDDWNKKNDGSIEPVVNVHVEPMGVYSKKLDKLSELKSGDTVGVPNDASNEARALKLLDKAGAIELKAGAPAVPGLNDIKDKKGLNIKESKAELLAPQLSDYDAAVINGNYAIAAKLSPKSDSLAIESAKNSPYANFLAVDKSEKKDPRVQKLAKLLNSDQVKKFIETHYKDGSVLPSFSKAS
ncbi:metal ABC transporter substrate-binding protein [Streptomyces sp. Ru73]|uniref:MetQ/NlpA family ABC transporter substrate-binding protein n=1 Tax=Streptomyces sp. Ru73 TaxID=2080748 RepID=UPI000CDD8766|nr:MetQ/NlpA family ABC transporter substrate-binding protein [Streptomyces sp. Ru73]POX43130.1 metal ABC transporter substrate-binding protein [Streptomyces sp. Ru73]